VRIGKSGRFTDDDTIPDDAGLTRYGGRSTSSGRRRVEGRTTSDDFDPLWEQQRRELTTGRLSHRQHRVSCGVLAAIEGFDEHFPYRTARTSILHFVRQPTGRSPTATR